eukprot:gene15407-4619_t
MARRNNKAAVAGLMSLLPSTADMAPKHWLWHLVSLAFSLPDS